MTIFDGVLILAVLGCTKLADMENGLYRNVSIRWEGA